MRVHGRSGTVTLASVEISGVTSFSYDVSVDSVDVTGMDSTGKEYIGGFKDGSGTVEMKFVPEDFTSAGTGGQDTVWDALDVETGVTVSLAVRDSGDAASGELVSYDGTVVVNAYTHSQSFDDAVSLTFGFQGVLTPAYKA